MQFQNIGIASDHAGKEMRRSILSFLSQTTVKVRDLGVAFDHETSVDYPDFAAKLATLVSEGKLQGGILICGTGIGMAMTANKFPHIRAASAWDAFSARMGREHNNANILCLGARSLSVESAMELVKIWLESPFQGGRHQARLDKILNLEKLAYHDCRL